MPVGPAHTKALREAPMQRGSEPPTLVLRRQRAPSGATANTELRAHSSTPTVPKSRMQQFVRKGLLQEGPTQTPIASDGGTIAYYQTRNL